MRRIWLALSILVTALAIIFIASVLAKPVLPSFNLRPIPSNLPSSPGERKAKKAQAELYYALFLAIDWISAWFAFLLERRERWSLLWWLFLQRFCYRQVMYYVMIKSVAMAIRGPVVGWGKLERKATAEAGP